MTKEEIIEDFEEAIKRIEEIENDLLSVDDNYLDGSMVSTLQWNAQMKLQSSRNLLKDACKILKGK